MKSFRDILTEEDGGVANTTANVDGLQQEPVVSTGNQRKYRGKNKLRKLLRRPSRVLSPPSQPNIPVMNSSVVASIVGIHPV
jgi:hypothetical protein